MRDDGLRSLLTGDGVVHAYKDITKLTEFRREIRRIHRNDDPRIFRLHDSRNHRIDVARAKNNRVKALPDAVCDSGRFNLRIVLTVKSGHFHVVLIRMLFHHFETVCIHLIRHGVGDVSNLQLLSLRRSYGKHTAHQNERQNDSKYLFHVDFHPFLLFNRHRLFGNLLNELQLPKAHPRSYASRPTRAQRTGTLFPPADSNRFSRIPALPRKSVRSD